MSLDLTSFSQDQFDDVLPQPVIVNIVEFEEYEAGKARDGKPVLRRRPVRREAEIQTYVPMKIFHRMMASQGKLKAIQQAAKGEGNIDESQQLVMLEWMAKQVLEVWKLTEPDMTEERLTEGLGFQQMIGLFSTFFGSQLKSLSAQANLP